MEHSYPASEKRKRPERSYKIVVDSASLFGPIARALSRLTLLALCVGYGYLVGLVALTGAAQPSEGLRGALLPVLTGWVLLFMVKAALSAGADKAATGGSSWLSLFGTFVLSLAATTFGYWRPAVSLTEKTMRGGHLERVPSADAVWYASMVRASVPEVGWAVDFAVKGAVFATIGFFLVVAGLLLDGYLWHRREEGGTLRTYSAILTARWEALAGADPIRRVWKFADTAKPRGPRTPGGGLGAFFNRPNSRPSSNQG